MARIILPMRYIQQPVKKDTGTIAVASVHGRFAGRVGPESRPTKNNPYLYSYHGPGDTTRARHLKQSTDLDNDGKIGPNERGGTIHGRTLRIRASSRAAGHTRRI